MNEGDHFSESVTFNAVGLDKVIDQTRQARLETDDLAAAQKRFADQIAKRLGYENHAQASNRMRLNQLAGSVVGPQQRGWGQTLREYGAVYSTARDRYLNRPGMMPQSQANAIASQGQAAAQRINQPIRINAQTVQLQVASMMQREADDRKRARSESERYRAENSGGGLGGNLIAAGVLAKSVSNVSKSLELSLSKINRGDARLQAELMMPKTRQSEVSAALNRTLPNPKIDPNALVGLSASQRSKAVSESKKDDREKAMEAFRAAINYKPNVEFEYRIAKNKSTRDKEGLMGPQPLPPELSNNAFGIFAQDLKNSLYNTLTVKDMNELASEAGLKNYSKLNKEPLARLLAIEAQKKVKGANQTTGEQWVEDPDWQKKYIAEMKEITKLSSTMRRAFDSTRDSAQKLGVNFKIWATSPEMQGRLAGARAVGRAAWNDYGRDGANKLGYAAAGAAGLGLGMAWQGLQRTAVGQQFNNQIERLQYELANMFGPALRKATEYVSKFSDMLSDLTPRQQRNLMYAGLGITGYSALRATGLDKTLLGIGSTALGVAGVIGGGVFRGKAAAAAAGGMMAVPAGFQFAGLQGGGMAAGGAAAGGGAGMLAGWGLGAAASAALVGKVGASAAYTGGGVLAAGAGLMVGQHLRQYLTDDYADERMKNFGRRSRGIFSLEEVAEINPNLEQFNRIQDPRQRDRAMRAKETELLRQQREHESQYSMFGRYVGDISIPLTGYRLGSYGRGAEKIQAELQGVEQARIKGKLEQERANKEPLAGGGFEGFLDTYRRTEEAVGRIDPGLQAGVVPRAGGGDQDKLAAAADKLAAAADKLQAVADKDAAPKADGKIQKNW